MMKISLSIERTVMICCLLILIEDSNAYYNEPNDELRVIHQEIGLLRNENKNQNIQIAQLKAEMEESKYKKDFNREMIDKLINEKIKEYLTDDTEDEAQEAVGRRSKRPARLLPLQLLFNQDDDDATKKPPPARFYGPPSNCSELAQLGYTLNGFYLVKPNKSSATTSNNDDNTKLEAVLCKFKQQGAVDASRIEKRVGLLQMESIQRDGIYFHAIWNKTYMDYFKEKILKFNYYLLNNGEAFRTAFPDYSKNDAAIDSPASMIYQAPESGVYQFVFTAIMKTPSTASTKAGNRSMIAHLHHNFQSVAQSVSPISGKVLLEATLNVSDNDVFQVIVKKPDTDEIQWASFSGHLLEKY